MLNLAPIKARLAAATPGPWSVAEIGGFQTTGLKEDDELIVNAPADLAALVAEVERLRAKVAELEADADSSEALDDAIWEGCFGPMSGEWGGANAKA